MSAFGRGQITPPTLPPDQYPCTLSSTTLMGQVCNWQNQQICLVGWMCTWTAPNWPLLTPQNHLRATHILIAFLAAAVETEQQDNDNRSIGMELLHWNHRKRSIRGCWHCRLQTHCQRQWVVHIIVKRIVISILFSRFNNVYLLRSMMADCGMPWHQEWGTMVAVGGWRPPWLACVCISPSFS